MKLLTLISTGLVEPFFIIYVIHYTNHRRGRSKGRFIMSSIIPRREREAGSSLLKRHSDSINLLSAVSTEGE